MNPQDAYLKTIEDLVSRRAGKVDPVAMGEAVLDAFDGATGLINEAKLQYGACKDGSGAKANLLRVFLQTVNNAAEYTKQQEDPLANFTKEELAAVLRQIAKDDPQDASGSPGTDTPIPPPADA